MASDHPSSSSAAAAGPAAEAAAPTSTSTSAAPPSQHAHTHAHAHAHAQPHAQQQQQQQQQPATPNNQNSTVAKRDLTSWWKRFNTRTPRREEEKGNCLSVSVASPLPSVPEYRPGYFHEVLHDLDLEADDGDPSKVSRVEDRDPDHRRGSRCARCAGLDMSCSAILIAMAAAQGGSTTASPPQPPTAPVPSASAFSPASPFFYPSRASHFRLDLGRLKAHLTDSPAVIEQQPQQPQQQPAGIFGVPLGVSILYANVAISLTDANGKSFIYGYVPIVVAKCGVFLKEKATDVEGIFRLSGSARRIKELQAIFDSPDRYGKGLDWTGFTVHDAANILRRYLNQLPEPIIPLAFYEQFRDPLRGHQLQAVGDEEAGAQDVGDFEIDRAIETYQDLITQIPPLSRQLLLYILDLLAVFASKSDMNRMNSYNLAAIFQPGILSHPTHDMAPQEYRLSQDVLVFLIENQDHFLIGMRGTAADEDTVREVQSGATPQSSTPTSAAAPGRAWGSLGRSSSNASAGAESVRKYGGLRRNVSVSSKHSKHSGNAPSPVSPGQQGSTAGSGGVHRSNTVPSKRSPALVSTRFNKPSDPPTPTSATLAPPGMLASGSGARSPSPGSRSVGPSTMNGGSPAALVNPSSPRAIEEASLATNPDQPGREKQFLDATGSLDTQTASANTPSKDKQRSFFARSPTSDNEKRESRQPNKLRKKRQPEGAYQSAHSSSHSLHGEGSGADLQQTQAHAKQLPQPAAIAGSLSQLEPITSDPAHPAEDVAPPHDLAPPPAIPAAGGSLRPLASPVPSFHSHSSVTDHSDFELGGGGRGADEQATTSDGPNHGERRHRWRFSSSHHKHDPSNNNNNNNNKASGAGSGSGSGAGPLGLISHSAANNSASSVDSAHRPTRRSIDNDPHPHPHPQESSAAYQPLAAPGTGSSASASGAGHDMPTTPAGTGAGATPTVKEGESKEKGPLGWFKAKVREHKEERREREAEKERAKSPPPPPAGAGASGVSGAGASAGAGGGSRQSLAGGGSVSGSGAGVSPSTVSGGTTLAGSGSASAPGATSSGPSGLGTTGPGTTGIEPATSPGPTAAASTGVSDTLPLRGKSSEIKRDEGEAAPTPTPTGTSEIDQDAQEKLLGTDKSGNAGADASAVEGVAGSS